MNCQNIMTRVVALLIKRPKRVSKEFAEKFLRKREVTFQLLFEKRLSISFCKSSLKQNFQD